MLLVMALLAAQVQQGDAAAVKATPISTIPWITNDDYPAEDARLRHQGVVAFVLRVDASGRAVKCDVAASSGHAGLDKATCFLLLRRSRFTPALDGSGNAVESSLSGRFSWILGKSRPTRAGVDGSVGSLP